MRDGRVSGDEVTTDESSIVTLRGRMMNVDMKKGHNRSAENEKFGFKHYFLT
jgi:hypothetical protein